MGMTSQLLNTIEKTWVFRVYVYYIDRLRLERPSGWRSNPNVALRVHWSSDVYVYACEAPKYIFVINLNTSHDLRETTS